jgi:hypothetical protein
MGKPASSKRAMAQRGRPRVPIAKKVREVRVYLRGEVIEEWQARHGNSWRQAMALALEAMVQGWKNSK